MASGSKRAVRLHDDALLLCSRQQLAAELKGAELHLVHHRLVVCRGDHLLQLVNVEVGHADRAGVAELTSPFHPGPCPGRTALRPVDDVEVDVIDAEAPEAALKLGDRVCAPWIELRGDEHLVARHSALLQSTPHALLVAVRLGGIDMPVAELERPTNRVDRRDADRNLPDAEAKHRDLVAIRERSQGFVCGL